VTQIISYSLLIFGFLSILVWVHQAIILPSIRQRLRFGLFALRDELRGLVINERVKESDPGFVSLHTQLNLMVFAVPRCDISMLYLAKRNSEELRKLSEKLRAQIEQSSPEVQEIYAKALDLLARAFVANSVFFILWIALVLGAPAAVTHGLRQLRCQLIQMVEPLFALRGNDVRFAA